jgi:hypothetical protein
MLVEGLGDTIVADIPVGNCGKIIAAFPKIG